MLSRPVFLRPMTQADALSHQWWGALDYQDAVSIAQLLQAGIEVDQAPNGWTALQYCVRTRRTRALRALLAQASPQMDRRNPDGHLPLHEAMRNYDEEMVEMLVEAGASLDAADAHGRNALHVLCRLCVGASKMYSTLMLFLRRGADPHAPGPEGCSAYQLAKECDSWRELMDEEVVRQQACALQAATPLATGGLPARRM